MKTQHRRTVVAIDDDEINLMILTKCAQEAGYAVKSFDSAVAGWEHMRTHPTEVDIVLLDKMMPDMNGMELLKRIKLDKAMQHVPVILQTGDVGISQMREGLESGAYYYLTKPFHPEILTAVLNSAAQECSAREELLKQVGENQTRFVSLLDEGLFSLRTHHEASQLASALSQLALYPEFVAVGLMELLSNAIEHGNLELGFERKAYHLHSGDWPQAVEQRMADATYGARRVHIAVLREGSIMRIAIRDEGPGFDWRKYVYSEAPPGATAEVNGRGISKSMIMLDEVKYSAAGNEVTCSIAMSPLMN